jgi:hypothetical protein
MNGEELRFRLACQARKIAGRIHHSVKPPQLDRRDLARIVDPANRPLVQEAVSAVQRGDALAAHRALGRHFMQRSSRWPLRAERRQAFVEALRRADPAAEDEARRRAERMLSGTYDLLGYRDVAVSNPPDWHADVISGRRAPSLHWTQVPHLDPAVGDHKVTWEINRHQYWLELGAAYWLTGDRRYRDFVIAHLEDWVATNPPLQGINWASMLELAFRVMSWTWTVEFFSDGAEDDRTPWLVDLLVSLDRQLTHITQNLSRYYSPNTHLTGEALALYTVSLAFPELRGSGLRVREGRDVLLGEIARQINEDGGHAELSAHYHRYTTDFYLLALMVGRAAGDPAAGEFERASRRLAVFLRTIADDRGRLPLIGDDDGGQLFAFGNRRPADASPTLNAAASLLHDDSLAVSASGPDAAWILGHVPVAPKETTRWSSRVLGHTGYFVSRGRDGSHLIFDAGHHGYLNGGHAHADALSVVLTIAREPLLVDPGTGQYIGDSAIRDRMRSARMHNTVILDGREAAVPRGPFHWNTRVDARLLTAQITDCWDFAVGTHDAYLPHRHLRAVLSLHGVGWLMVDRIVAGRDEVEAQAWWHLHPAWGATATDGGVDLESSSGRRAVLSTTAADIRVVDDPALAAYAPEYGRIERATAICATSTGSEAFSIGTFIPAEATLQWRIVELPTQGRGNWVVCPFAIVSDDTRVEVEVAFPSAHVGHSTAAAIWPQPCIAQLKQSCVE